MAHAAPGKLSKGHKQLLLVLRGVLLVRKKPRVLLLVLRVSGLAYVVIGVAGGKKGDENEQGGRGGGKHLQIEPSAMQEREQEP